VFIEFLLPDNVMPINGRAGTEPRSTDRNYTAGPVRCIGGLSRLPCGQALWAEEARATQMLPSFILRVLSDDNALA
jgi:hypothetical protein